MLPRSAPHAVEKPGISDFRCILRQLDVGPGNDVGERPVAKGPAREAIRSQIGVVDVPNAVEPVVVEPGNPLSRGVGVTGPKDLFARKSRVTKRMIEHHRPPETDVPCQPRNAGRSNVVAFVFRPVGRPASIGVLPDVQPTARGTPQTLGGAEAIEVIARQLPGNIQLPEQEITLLVMLRQV